jgi:hypothetical protein
MSLLSDKPKGSRAVQISLRTLCRYWILTFVFVLFISPDMFTQDTNAGRQAGSFPGLIARWNFHLGSDHAVVERLSGT